MVDTRAKIITVEEAGRIAASSAPRVATGCFNPLRTEHARKLAKAASGNGRPLLVIVRQPDSPLLDLRARAELVAALSVVDYVVPIETAQAPEWLDRVPRSERLELETVDESLTRDLIERVRGRHS